MKNIFNKCHFLYATLFWGLAMPTVNPECGFVNIFNDYDLPDATFYKTAPYFKAIAQALFNMHEYDALTFGLLLDQRGSDPLEIAQREQVFTIALDASCDDKGGGIVLARALLRNEIIRPAVSEENQDLFLAGLVDNVCRLGSSRVFSIFSSAFQELVYQGCLCPQTNYDGSSVTDTWACKLLKELLNTTYCMENTLGQTLCQLAKTDYSGENFCKLFNCLLDEAIALNDPSLFSSQTNVMLGCLRCEVGLDVASSFVAKLISTIIANEAYNDACFTAVKKLLCCSDDTNADIVTAAIEKVLACPAVDHDAALAIIADLLSDGPCD